MCDHEKILIAAILVCLEAGHSQKEVQGTLEAVILYWQLTQMGHPPGRQPLTKNELEAKLN